MDFFSRIWNFFSGIQQAPQTPVGDLAAFEAVATGAAAPVARSADQALRVSTVHACWKVLGESVAGLPMKLYEATGSRRKVADGEPLHEFFAWRPGPDLTPFDLFEWTMVSMLATGKAAWQKIMNGTGDLIDLVPLDVTRLYPPDPEKKDRVWRYQIGPGKTTPFKRSELWLCNYFCGLSPIAIMRYQLEGARAQDDHAREFFANGAVMGGSVERPGEWKPEDRDKFRASLKERHGQGNAYQILLLWGGMKYTPMASVSMRDAQFLEARRFSKEEICAVYRVPPHFVADLSHATFSNVEHQDIALSKHTVRPWCERIEQSMNRDLLPEQMRGRFYFAFSMDALLRGDYQSRMEGYSKGVQGTILTPNEARAFEDLPPRPGGDNLLFPVNVTVGPPEKPAPPPEAPPAPIVDEPEDEAEAEPEDQEEAPDGSE